MLPRPVLEQARDELVDWQNTGMSVMEMSHRSPAYMRIIEEATADLRTLMDIPAHYHVLFLQGGAQGQFSAVPLNLIGRTGTADYVDTGHWSKLAIAEARKYGAVRVVASSADQAYTTLPAFENWQRDPNAAYLHYTPNETVGGLEFQWVPETGAVPLVADMSSNILSRQIDVNQFGIIYAGAQKNIGPSGVTVVLVREDLIEHALPITPVTYHYKRYAEAESMYNTPSTYGIYIAGLVFKWLKKQGGVAAIEQQNRAKSDLLYQYLDHCDGFYHAPIHAAGRSRMNVVFHLRSDALNDAFLRESAAAGLLQLKGHKIAGGMRASIYNAMPIEGVLALISFMKYFADQHR